MKYEDKILKMNIAEMCPEDQAHYGAIQEEIRGRYRQNTSSSDIDLNLDWLFSCNFQYYCAMMKQLFSWNTLS